MKFALGLAEFWWAVTSGLVCRYSPWECPGDREYREAREDYRRRWLDRTSGL